MALTDAEQIEEANAARAEKRRLLMLSRADRERITAKGSKVRRMIEAGQKEVPGLQADVDALQKAADLGDPPAKRMLPVAQERLSVVKTRIDSGRAQIAGAERGLEQIKAELAKLSTPEDEEGILAGARAVIARLAGAGR